MNNLANLALALLTIYLLAPIAAAMHNDLHMRFIKVIGQSLSTNAEAAFIGFQVLVGCALVVATISSFLLLKQEEYIGALIMILLAAFPVAIVHITLVFVT